MRRSGVRLPTEVDTPPGYRSDIQGLRGVAVGLVLLDHAGLRLFGGGYIGVDVFFVISGFLITGHLLSTLRERGRVDLLAFYAARARRILPAALVVVVLSSVAAMVLVSPLRLRQILSDAVSSALYVPNFTFALRQTDYLAGTDPSPFQHYWSLGIEEQFYLIWPLFLVALFLLSGRSVRPLAIGIAAAAVISFGGCLILMNISQPWAFFSFPTRAWELAIGGLLAATITWTAKVPNQIARVLTWIGLAAILGSALVLSRETIYPGWTTLVPVVGAVFVIGFGRRQAGDASFFLYARPLQFIGLISYSLYLVHWPILVLVQESTAPGVLLNTLEGIALVCAAVPLAWLLFRFVETPFRRPSSSHSGEAKKAVWSSIVASMLLAVVLSGAGAATELAPLQSSRTAPPTTAERSPAGSTFVPSNMLPSLASATADTGEIYTNGCQQGLRSSEVVTCSFGNLESSTVVALFGDSHAGRWFPALQAAAELEGFRLDTYTKSGCRSQETNAAWNASANPTCSKWRNTVVSDLNDHPPDIIFMTNHIGPQLASDAEDQYRAWKEGTERSIKRLPPESRIVTLADTPEFASSPVYCLASHLDDARSCSVSRASALNPAVAQAQADAARITNTTFVDMNDYFCGAKYCPAVIGATLVYSDEHHVSATWSRLLGPAIAPYLAEALSSAELTSKQG